MIDKRKRKIFKESGIPILPIIGNIFFWGDVTLVYWILALIYKIQFFSKADNYLLYWVLDN